MGMKKLCERCLRCNKGGVFDYHTVHRVYREKLEWLLLAVGLVMVLIAILWGTSR